MSHIKWTRQRGNRDVLEGQPGNYQIRARRDIPSPHLNMAPYDVYVGDTQIGRVMGPAAAKRNAEKHLRSKSR
jgi:hypothetical protein